MFIVGAVQVTVPEKGNGSVRYNWYTISVDQLYRNETKTRIIASSYFKSSIANKEFMILRNWIVMPI